MTSVAPIHLVWPADRFYWAVLDGARVARPGRGVTTEQLGFLFENVLPGIAIEDMHVLYRRAGGKGRTYVACGVPRAVLEKDVDQAALTLAPEALPAFVDAAVDPARLNFLTGPFRPAQLRRMQRRWIAHGLVLVALCVGLLVTGMERRRLHARDAVARLEAARQQTLEAALDRDEAAIASTAPMDLQLISELRRLEQTRSDTAGVQTDSNCAALLARLLAEWPTDVASEIRAIVIDPAVMTVRCRVPAMSDVQRVVNALADMPDWRVTQPQSQLHGGKVEVTLTLESHDAEADP